MVDTASLADQMSSLLQLVRFPNPLPKVRRGLSLVEFQLWRVLEQPAPEFFLNNFFKTGDLSMVQLTQNMQKNSKK